MNDKKTKKNTVIAVIIFVFSLLSLSVFLILNSDIMEGKIKPLELPFTVRSLVDPETAKISDNSILNSARKYGGALSDLEVKGIYVDPKTLSDVESRKRIITFAKENGINAFLFDIRDESGNLLYPSLVEDVKRLKNDQNIRYPDFPSLMNELEAADILPIARICMLRDRTLGETVPEWAIKNSGGQPWKDRSGHYWIDPSSEDASVYLSSLVKESFLLGFSEVVLDYLRYPVESTSDSQIPQDENQRVKNVGEMISRIKNEVSNYSLRLSIATSGRVTSMTGERGTGQRLDMLYRTAESFSPMIFPSNYYGGELGLKYPYAEPYRVVKESLSNALEELSLIEDPNRKTEFRIRPVIQAFSAPWLKQSYKEKYFEYEENEILEQIRALQDCGIREWILWNSKSDYPKFEKLR